MENGASNKSEADREASDVEKQDEIIARELKKLNSAESVLHRKARDLGLVDNILSKNSPSNNNVEEWWKVYTAQYSDLDSRPNIQKQAEDAKEYFALLDLFPPSGRRLKLLRKASGWDEKGRRPNSTQ